jgi:hypothetical protein
VHLSYVDANTVSKRTEMKFHMTHITKVFYQVCPKRFSNLWYARRKPCTYLALILRLSPNGPKWDSMCPRSPRCSIGCVQCDFRAYGTFSANRATYLALRIALSPNEPKRASTWASSPKSTIRCVQNDFWGYGILGTNRAAILHWY